MAAGDNTHVTGLPTLYLMYLLSGSDREQVKESLAAEAGLVFFVIKEQKYVFFFFSTP